MSPSATRSTRTKEARRQQLFDLLGDLPDRTQPVGVTDQAEEGRPGYVLEKLTLNLNGIEPVPAYFAKPKAYGSPYPAVLYNHAHGSDYGLGKDELICGRDFLQYPPYADALTAKGFAALCIDHWAFGERAGRSESAIFKEMLWKGQVMWGMMVYDSLRALDYLSSRPDVDHRRIGVLGMSMGSTMAWWLAALDTRVKICIDICCLSDYEALIEADGLDEHGIYYYVPGLLKHFTSAAINALISPRPHLSLAGRYDKLTPEPGLIKIDRELRECYRQDGAPEAWQLIVYDCAHEETAAMRVEALSFLERHL